MARSARSNRQQLVCILADDSGSMAGERAEAATNGIRDMLKECRSRGQGSISLFKLLLVRFSDEASINPGCDLAPVHKIEPDQVAFRGEGSATNITAALALTLERLRPYVERLKAHPEVHQHPIPLVLLFSDGEHNVGSGPIAVSDQIKRLKVGGEPVIIVSAGVLIEPDSDAETTLRAIATPGCYFSIADIDEFRRFLAIVGSLEISGPQDIKQLPFRK